MRIGTIGALALVLVAAALQDEDKTHPAVYEKVVDSVVAVRAEAPLGERSGTGVVLRADGLIMVSYAVVPEGAQNIRVWTKGPRMYKAQFVASSKKDEITLLKVEPDRKLKPIRFGASSRAKIGEVAYTLGNAQNSFINDDSPAFNTGIVSGFYNLRETRLDSTYTGYVFETTAAVNQGMDGAPLLNADGEMIGMVTLNYSPHRWLGNAIPVDPLRLRIEQLTAAAPKAPESPEAPAGDGYLGFTVRAGEGGVVVAAVDESGPAKTAGIAPGDLIESIAGKSVKTVEEFEKLTRPLKSGTILWLKLRVMESSQEVKLELGTRTK
jgi:serine protease Do